MAILKQEGSRLDSRGTSRRGFLEKAALGGLGIAFLAKSNDVAASVDYVRTL